MSQILKLLAVLIVGALIGYFVGNRQELAQSSLLVVQQETLDRQGKAIGQLKTELGVKDTQLATQKAAFEQLQTTLKSQEAQVQELKRQLAFFERIMRPTGEQVGVVIDNLTLQETSIPGRYHYRLALTQPAKKRELFRGQVQIRVEGSQGDKPRVLTGRDLGMKVSEWRYALRYFQLLEGNWQLPEGFVPDRIRVTINKDGRQPAQELLVEWGEVIKPLVAAPPAPVPATGQE
ncbi:MULTISPECIES: DUF6776 family protein [Aeromonas]|uniref:Uncharacterized protein n=2 Tax=Aeromonas TaxID=642 RepID=A0A175VI04_AEREN|nr:MULTISPECIES: DUF6776 family protein [Aeromonas]KXU80119.1 hypothetical protein LCR_16175 [Aeromonas enteropelogenes]MBL0522403.1 hypothetical protein [Aeromonas enteropelogenes]MCZ0752268.1 hypothetical protein [Aeromonas enteropelogenes]QXC34491.1 hypothetical protein I6L37_01930 [Aeromonas sp. FDAARGOS 1407]RQM69170.1 hypothetical protein EHZ64_03945 [Aeromonas enteropelogenes]